MTVPVEGDPVEEKGQFLARMVIQEVALHMPASEEALNDQIYCTLRENVCKMLRENEAKFVDMASRISVQNYLEYRAVAYPLFEMSEESSQPTITWGRIIALFAFTTQIAQRYNDDPAMVACIGTSLCLFLQSHINEWIRAHDCWEGLVEEFKSEPEYHIKSLLLTYLGIAVGVAASVIAMKRLIM